MDIISKLQRNPKDTYLEASRLLIKIADNILKEPSNQRIRTLQKSNATLSNKLLNVPGARECLLLMGFVERNKYYVFLPDASLDKLKCVKNDIIKYEQLYIENNGVIPQPSVTMNADGELIRRIELPQYKRVYKNEFLHQVGYHFHIAQLHNNPYFIDRARGLIPRAMLDFNASENLRDHQVRLKKRGESDIESSLQDMLISELLNWFKKDFFTWVDNPPCENCQGTTRMSHMCRDPNLLRYTDRVEMHRCDSCGSLTPFPRYNDLNILMETRKGRCGEWANCFTLFCRAMGWDARHVFDETDHVWTEVYSFGKRRWVHCDPCENVCDSPLIYEAGWNKQVSYVMAYSSEEVQDVTWRYSSKHKEVLLRRTKCKEEELIQIMLDLRKQRQSNLSECRRNYITRRILEELCEFLVEKQPTEADRKGRSSGSLAWRVSRDEKRSKQMSDFSPYIWQLFDDDLEENLVNIRYSIAEDSYEMFAGKKKRISRSKWYAGMYRVENIFRKEEKDWKMVYLARTEDANVGRATWTFEVNSFEKVFDVVDIKLDHQLYENGKVEITAQGDKEKIRFLQNEKHLKSQLLSGSTRIDIVVELSGGRGDVAWQHAQLFRQSTESTDFGFDITFTFKSKQ